ncbi:MAG: hypothetical protein K2G90_09430 [Muribaculaceae bacterium]|nr:hypothetical protein [Muribaculaceae bacterium]
MRHSYSTSTFSLDATAGDTNRSYAGALCVVPLKRSLHLAISPLSNTNRLSKILLTDDYSLPKGELSSVLSYKQISTDFCRYRQKPPFILSRAPGLITGAA